MNYFYNGIKLSEFDFAAHPNALIVQFVENGNYGLICPSTPFWIVNHNGGEVVALSPEADVDVFTCASGDSIWQQTDSQFEPEPGAIWVSLNPSTYQYVWTKADICRENSTQVVYSGSDPVEEVIQEHNWLGSFKLGLSTGLCGKPLPIKKPGPVAYLYNGLRLPKLPEYCRDSFPYVAIIVIERTGSISLRATKEPLKIRRDTTGGIGATIYPPYRISSLLETGEWSKGLEQETEGSVDYRYFHWSNHDILYDDDYFDADKAGTTFLEATDPIPVYE